MLSDPNVSQIMPKVGNRYESALAIAKRARNIEERRVIEGDTNIKDAVDIAANEIATEQAYVKKNGVYVIEPKISSPIIKEDIEEINIEEIVKE